MRLVIELNGDPSRLDLATAVVRRRGAHEMLVLLRATDRALIAAAHEAFGGLLPRDAIRIWMPPETGASPDVEAALRETVIAALGAEVLLSVRSASGIRHPLPASLPVCVLLDTPTDDSPSRTAWTEAVAALRDDLLRVNRIFLSDETALPALPDAVRAALCRIADADSPEAAADRIIAECEKAARTASETAPPDPESRPRLAFVSPFPPARSGIAEYSAQLMGPLSKHYRIHLVTDQKEISDPRLFDAFPVHDPDWLKANAAQFDRVLYHFGNSPIHRFMYDLLPVVPGIVVLHDFFLLDGQGGFLSGWARRETILRNHGIAALIDAPQLEAASIGVEPWPGSLDVLQTATGVIVHGEEPCRLAEQWYGPGAARDWHRIPHLRRVAEVSAERRHEARARLGFSAEDIVICSFGDVGPTKLNLEVTRALTRSRLASNPNVRLIFVGAAPRKYETRIADLAGLLPAARCRITGWVDAHGYEDHLLAADIAVQLRSKSRGETSGAVVDCLSHGLPTIVNAHGSMRDLDADSVLRIADPVDEDALARALETLVDDAALRARLAARARQVIAEEHDPEGCANGYRQAIERSVRSWRQKVASLPARLARTPMGEAERLALARSLAFNFPPSPRQPVLFVDVTAVAAQDIHTGVQRVVRSILKSLFKSRDLSHRVVPVRLAETGEFVQALRFAEKIADLPIGTTPEDPIDVYRGDLILILDLEIGRNAERRRAFERFRDAGAEVWHVVHDLLPVHLPQYFPESEAPRFADWLDLVHSCDGAACVSDATAHSLRAWLAGNSGAGKPLPRIGRFHLGADLRNSVPTHGLPKNALKLLDRLKQRPTFLMVGTVEPRKGHAQTLAAFEQLWAEGVEANLVIVGKEGWQVKPLVRKLRALGKKEERLFWLDGISDEYLERIYQASDCLIAASEGEGFGLPLIEAAQHRLPILARDLPVFREVVGPHGAYFAGLDPAALADAVRGWLSDHAAGRTIRSEAMPWLTWDQSAAMLLGAIGIGPADIANPVTAEPDQAS